jgi:peptidyl-prolyl cis-trans isomerase B (cyclophilin B)
LSPRTTTAALAGLVLAGAVALTGCTTAVTGGAQNGSSGSGSGAAGGTAAAPAGDVSCDYQATPQQPAPQGKDVGLPPGNAPKTGDTEVDLTTSVGPVDLTLNRGEAPCTVASFVFLAQQKYFDNTPCHRLTSADGLKVLQCGDPTGSGSGGPGYTIPDENPTNLKSASVAPGADVYPRGTVAMANTGQPHSGGSQFFLVYGDSYLPPSYSVFGTVGSAGLSTLDKIAAGGITPGQNPETGAADPTDGKPTIGVTISAATPRT